MSARLFIELREKNSLVYTVDAGQYSYNTGGYFSIETQLKSKNIEKTVSIILHLWTFKTPIFLYLGN